MSVNKKENLPPVAQLTSPTMDNLTDESETPVFFISASSTGTSNSKQLILDGCDSTDENDDKLEYKFWNPKKLTGMIIKQINPTDCKATVEHITEEGDYIFEVINRTLK